jgi:peptidoglycan/LPS O-acetylase OafA/YrhL
MAALILWASISGPQILFLFPLWLLGCALYDVYQQVRVKLVATVLRRLTLLYAIAALALAAIGHTSLLLAPVHLDRIIATLPSPLTFLHQGSIRATMLAIANGTVAAAVMFLLLLLSDLVPLARHHPFARRFRRLADGTFAIYLMHYPLMILARSLNLLRPHFPLLDTVTMTVVVLSLIAIAAPLERLKSALRGTLHKVRFRQRTPAPQPVHTLP